MAVHNTEGDRRVGGTQAGDSRVGDQRLVDAFRAGVIRVGDDPEAVRRAGASPLDVNPVDVSRRDGHQEVGRRLKVV